MIDIPRNPRADARVLNARDHARVTRNWRLAMSVPPADAPAASIGQRVMRIAAESLAAMDLDEPRRDIVMMINAIFAQELDNIAPDHAERVFYEWRAAVESGDWAAAVMAALPPPDSEDAA